jgi:hypothetical protein
MSTVFEVISTLEQLPVTTEVLEVNVYYFNNGVL